MLVIVEALGQRPPKGTEVASTITPPRRAGILEPVIEREDPKRRQGNLLLILAASGITSLSITGLPSRTMNRWPSWGLTTNEPTFLAASSGWFVRLSVHRRAVGPLEGSTQRALKALTQRLTPRLPPVADAPFGWELKTLGLPSRCGSLSVVFRWGWSDPSAGRKLRASRAREQSHGKGNRVSLSTAAVFVSVSLTAVDKTGSLGSALSMASVPEGSDNEYVT